MHTVLILTPPLWRHNDIVHTRLVDTSTVRGRLAPRGAALGAAMRHLPPAGLIQRILAWDDARRSAAAMGACWYFAVYAGWTQYVPLALLFFAWGAMDDRAHDVFLAREGRKAQQLRWQREQREHWEGPSHDAFVESSNREPCGDGDDNGAAAWPSYADGRATTRALLRATPGLRIWQEEEPGARAQLRHAAAHHVEAGADAAREKLRQGIKALRAATDAKSLAQSIVRCRDILS